MYEMLLAARNLDAESCGSGWVPLGNSGTGVQAKREPRCRKIGTFMSCVSDINTSSQRLSTREKR